MARGYENLEIVEEDDADIETLIQRELDALGDDVSLDHLETDEGLNHSNQISHETEGKNEELEIETYEKSLNQYLELINYNQLKAKETIQENQKVLGDAQNDDSTSMDTAFADKLKYLLNEDDPDADSASENLLHLRDEALADLERYEVQKENDKAENKLTVAIYQPDLIEEIAKLEEEENKKLEILLQKQDEEKKAEAEFFSKIKEDFDQKGGESDRKLLERMKEVEENLKMFEAKERSLVSTDANELKILRKIDEELQEKIKEIDNEKQREEKEFFDLKAKIDEERAIKRLNAVLVVQKTYRGYRARKMYGPQIKNLRDIRRKLEEERWEEIAKAEEHLKEEETRKKLEEERLEKERLERERLEKARLLKERLEKERLEKEKLEKKRLEKKRLEEERLEREMLEKERFEKEKVEKERLEKEKLEKERLMKERLEKEKFEKERLEKERLEKERLEKERLRKERLEKERLKKERLEKERLEKERLEKGKLEKERIANERFEKERLEEERLEKERLVKERLEREQLEKERLEKEFSKKERLEKERLEKDRLEKERLEKERLEKERLEKERLVRDRSEIERLKKTKERLGKDWLGREKEEKRGFENLEEMRKKWLIYHKASRSTIKSGRISSGPKAKSRFRVKKSLEALPELDLLKITSSLPEEVTPASCECLVESDLAGTRMKGIENLPNVKIVKMTNCNLEAVECIEKCDQLEKLDLPRNKIDTINTQFQAFLRHLSLPGNLLSSTNGLESLANLEFLDLSCNRITRIGSISSCEKLQTLILSDNQLISLKGIEPLRHLTVLDASKNHLGNAKEIENLSLLTRLNLHSNTITTVTDFRDHVLLRDLDLSENNLTNLDLLSEAWLPSLERINVAGNSIEEMPQLNHLIMLKSMEVQDNLIKEKSKLLPGLLSCNHLAVLKISGNPVVDTPGLRSSIENHLPFLQFLDETQLNYKPRDLNDIEPFEEMCIRIKNGHEMLCKEHRDQLSQLDMIKMPYNFELAKLEIERQHRKEDFELLLSSLKEHESYGEQQQTLDYSEESHVIEHESAASAQEASATVEAFEEVAVEEQPSQAISDISHVTEMVSGHSEKQDPDRNCKRHWTAQEESAAIKIQSVYRGYRVRRVLFSALELVRQNYDKEGDDDDDEFNYDEEVDLTAFDFDEVPDWRPSDTPQMPRRNPVLPPTGKQSISNEDRSSNLPKHAWQSLPRTPEVSVSGRPEPLKLDLSPDQSDVTSTVAESVASRRKEELRMEWGFQNSLTADLMMKRAKKMNAAGRKKNFLGLAPDKRYELFKKLQQAKPNMEVRPPAKKKTSKRVEYFSAQREDNSPSSLSTDRDFKEEMTYSWVCNQAVLHSDAYHDIISDREQTGDSRPKNKIKSGERISLPHMDPAIIAGKNLPLVLMSSRGMSNPSLASAEDQRTRADKGEDRSSKEKSRSAPISSKRTPPVSHSSSSRSSSSDSRRRKR